MTTGERTAQVDAKLRELREADRQREKLTWTLQAGANPQLAGDELVPCEQAVASRETEMKARQEARDRALAEREAVLREQEKNASKREQALAQRGSASWREHSRIQARREALDEREADLRAMHDRLRHDAERLERGRPEATGRARSRPPVWPS